MKTITKPAASKKIPFPSESIHPSIDQLKTEFLKHATYKPEEVLFIKMRVIERCQRPLNQRWLNYLIANLNVMFLGEITLSYRDNWYNIIDGHHRVEAVKIYLNQWQDQKLTCTVWHGLNEAQEALLFLKLQDTLRQTAINAFLVAITAKCPTEVEINRVVNKVGLHVANNNNPESIRSVAALVRVFNRSNSEVLETTLQIVHGAYGALGLTSHMIDGFGLLVQRYNGLVDPPSAIQTLQSVAGGINSLRGPAEELKLKTGATLPVCIAAQAVHLINRNRRGKAKLPSWWAT